MRARATTRVGRALRAIARRLGYASAGTDDDLRADKPPMEFVQGQCVEVIVNARNTTCHRGTVRSVVWHYKAKKWMYLPDDGGRRVSKRYEASDLRAT